jgi:hypothetical protein
MQLANQDKLDTARIDWEKVVQDYNKFMAQHDTIHLTDYQLAFLREFSNWVMVRL